MAREGAEVAELVARYAPERPVWRLFQFTPTGALKRIDEWGTPDNPADLVDLIEARAVKYTNFHARGSAIAFELQVVQVFAQPGEKEERLLASEQWHVSPEILPGGHSMTELATDAGLVAQAMRHAEGYFRTSVTAMNAQSRSNADMISALSRQVAAQQAVVVKAYKVIEDGFNNQHLRQIEARKLESDIKRKDQLGEKIGNLLPVVGRAVMGKYKPEGLALMSAEVAKSLFASMTQQQIEGMLALMDDEQRAQMLTLYRDMVAAHEAAQPRETETH